jgi:autotransporter-associated beta strand protein
MFGDNSYNGLTTVEEGTLVAAHDNALGLNASTVDVGEGTTVFDGATLGIQEHTMPAPALGAVTIDEPITATGTGAANRDGAVTNIAGNNEVTAVVTSGGLEIGIGSEADTLLISNSVELIAGKVTFDGAGNIDVTGVINGDLAPGVIPELGGITSGLQVWFDASDIDGAGDGATGDPAPGAQVDTWVDKSGNNHTATRVSNTPVVLGSAINGLPAVEMVGNEYFNVADNLFAKTIISVFRAGSGRTSWNNHGATFARRSGRGSNWLLQNGNKTLHGNQYPARVFKDGSSIANPFNMSPINEFMALTVEVNDNSTGDALYYLGRSDHSQTDIEVAEVIAYDSVLSDAARGAVEAYLGNKYGIAGSFGTFSNDVMKMGGGVVTLTGANSFTGETNVMEGTLVAASATALDDTSAVNISDGGALGLDGGVTISGVPIVVNGTGATADLDADGTPEIDPGIGAIVNISGNNIIDATSSITAEQISLGEIGIGSLADELLIQTDVDLEFSKLTVDGAGDVTIDGVVGGTGGPQAIQVDLVDGVAGQNDSLYHFGFARGGGAEDQGQMDLTFGPTSMFENGDPSAHSRLLGTTLLTDGPGARGLDFDNDGDFTGSGAIVGRNDNYTNLWLGTLSVSAADAGNWSFTYDQHDDWYGIWLDLNQDGDFDSTTAGLGSNRGEQLRWNDAGTVTVNLAEGEYLAGFTHLEGGGGSQARVQVQNTNLARTTIKPTDPAQAGLWSSLRTLNFDANNALMKMGDGTLQLNGVSTYNGETNVMSGTLDVDGSITGDTTTVANGATLSGDGSVATPVAGERGSVVWADGPTDLVIGDGTDAGYTTGGKTLVDAGVTLQVNDSNAVELGEFTIVDGTMNVSGGEVEVAAGNLSGSGTLNANVSNFTTGLLLAGNSDNTGDNIQVNTDGSLVAAINFAPNTISDATNNGVTFVASDSAAGTAGGLNYTLSGVGTFGTADNSTARAKISNRISHYGYHVNNDAATLNLHNNGGMLNGGDPTGFGGFFGEAILTDGPGNRGLDFNGDGEFIATGAIGQNDNYSDLFLTTLTVGPGQGGVWNFRINMHDDPAGIWLDLDQDGVFESGNGGLGDANGELIAWNGGCCAQRDLKSVTLAEGEYAMAFTHREGGGGSQIDITFAAPGIGERTIKPTDPAQDGLWSVIGGADAADDLFFSDAGFDSQTDTLTLSVDGLDDSKSYVVEVLHGDARVTGDGDGVYDIAISGATNGGSAAVNGLSFGTGDDGDAAVDAEAKTSVSFVVNGDTGFNYDVTQVVPVPPQVTGDGLMNVQYINTSGSHPGNNTANWLALWDALDAGNPDATGAVAGRTIVNNNSDVEFEFDYPGGGNFGVNHSLASINSDGPGGGGATTSGDNYSIRGRSFLAFNTAGTYTIALGSDDGRRIELTEAVPGSAPGYGGFASISGQINGPFTAGDTVFGFSAGTGHNNSRGVFTVAAGDVLELDAFYYEGGGGDSGEISIATGAQTAFNGFQLLADGVFDIAMGSTNDFALADVRPPSIAGFQVRELGSALGNVSPGSDLGGDMVADGVDDANEVGTLTTGSVTFAPTPNSVFDIDFTPTANDGIVANGTVDITDVTLNVGGSVDPVTQATIQGQEHLIIDNDAADAVTGTFDGLAEGDVVNITGGRFHISYVAGTGNDVSLTANTAPVAVQDGPFTILEDATISEAAPGVLANDTDINAVDVVTASLVTGPTNAQSFTLNPDGSWDYVPTEHFSGSDSFVYLATDGELDSAEITVVIDITPVADVPNLAVGSATINTTETQTVALNITSSLVDTDGSETLTATIDGVPAGATLSPGTLNGTTYELTAAELAVATITMPDNLPADAPFTLTITATATEAGNGNTASAIETIDVTFANVAPSTSISGPTSTVPNYPIPFVVNVSDISPVDNTAGFDVVIDWGDGGPNDTFGPGATGPIDIIHAFADFGNFDVVVTATDKDGGVATYTHNIQVDPVAIIGTNLFVGGTDIRNDRIILQSAARESIYVRYNNVRYGPFAETSFDTAQIFGGAGNDRISITNICISTEIFGQEGNDQINGGRCNDLIDGGPGRDTLLTGEGDNSADGGPGNDIIQSRSGTDILRGGSGNDRLAAGEGDDQLFGDDGNDQLIGDGGADLLVGGIGNDVLIGGSGNDVAIGGLGNDRLIGGNQDDLLVGGAGLDSVQGGRGTDVLTGGDAVNEDDEAALIAVLTSWNSTRDRLGLGNFMDDSEEDGLNGNGGPDDIYVGIEDIVARLRPADNLLSL